MAKVGKNKNAKNKAKHNKLLAQKTNKKKAEKDAEKKIKIVKDSSETRTYVLGLGSVLLMFVLGGVLLFHRKRKQQIAKQNKKLQEDYKWLQNQYASLKENLQQLSVEKNNKADVSEKYKNSSLTKKDREDYMNHILEFMEQEKPYLDFDLTQAMLAEKLEINTYHLSEVLNLSFEQNFYTFINFYRIDNAQKLLKTPAFKNYKIEAIAYDSGFKSKASFNRVFKNITGKTPSEFKKL